MDDVTDNVPFTASCPRYAHFENHRVLVDLFNVSIDLETFYFLGLQSGRFYALYDLKQHRILCRTRNFQNVLPNTLRLKVLLHSSNIAFQNLLKI